GTLAQGEQLLDQLLHALRDQVQERVDLLDLVAAHRLTEVAPLLPYVQRSQVDHRRSPKRAVPIRTIVLPSRIATARSLVIPMDSSAPKRSARDRSRSRSSRSPANVLDSTRS